MFIKLAKPSEIPQSWYGSEIGFDLEIEDKLLETLSVSCPFILRQRAPLWSSRLRNARLDVLGGMCKKMYIAGAILSV